MKKRYKIISLLLVLLLFGVSCSKKEEPELAPLVEELEEEIEEVQEEEEEIEEEQQVLVPRSLLSGVEVAGELAELPIVGVMLDNHPNARWQAGLREAEIVYEIRVEGNFTRYLALFQVTDPEVIGPIRSARTPFITRILEYDAIFAHFGASAHGTKSLNSFGVHSVDGMAVGLPVYYRNHSVGKEAPHNAYSSMAEIREYTQSRSFPEKTEFEGYEFYDEPTAPGGEKVEEFTLYIMPGNTTAYSYLSEEGIYHRYKDGALHIDENDGEPLEVTNVIVQFVGNFMVDSEGPTDIGEVGEGKGLFFSQGEQVEITWEKADREAPTVFFDQEGQPLQLNIGQTFIQVVDENLEINME